MRSLIILLLIIISVASVRSDITGQWISDIQNQVSDNQPYGFNISQLSNGSFYIMYNNSATPHHNDSVLTQNGTTGTWTDSDGQQLFYNSTTDTVLFPTVANPLYALFSRNGSYFSAEQIFGFSAGMYSNPVPLSSSDNCNMPNSFELSPINQALPTNLNFRTIACNTSDCPDPYFFFFIKVPGTENITYASLVTADFPNGTVWFLPGVQPLKATLMIDSCIYQYERLQTHLISGTWQLDWQSFSYTPFVLFPSMPSYQIDSHNNSFMTAVDTAYGTSVPVNLFQIGTYSYYDYKIHSTFEYNPTINALTFDSYLADGSAAPVIYSQNGSLFNSTPFIDTWGNPQDYNGNPVSDFYCAPHTIQISPSNNSYTLLVTYKFLSTSLSCWFKAYIQNNQLQANLSIAYPSLYQLYWKDEYGTNITFLNPDDPSEILVSLKNGYTFVMDNDNNYNAFSLHYSLR